MRLRNRVKQVLGLGAFDFCEDWEVGSCIFEIWTLDSSHIVELWVLWLYQSFHPLLQLLNVLIDSLCYFNCVASTSFKIVLLGPNVHQLSWRSIKVSLHLLQITTLAEQRLTNGAALVFQNLLALNVRTLGSLHELIPIIFVPHLQVIQSRLHRFNLFLAFLVFGVQFITVTLQLLLFLGSLNNIVDLRMFTDSFSLTGCWLIFLD